MNTAKEQISELEDQMGEVSQKVTGEDEEIEYVQEKLKNI
jgi:predicted  nucleic acid-binding Zn-ribbon protein